MIRVLTETGMRHKGLRSIDYENVHTDKRYIITKEKYGVDKCYYITADLARHLSFYIEARKTLELDTKALFISTQLKRISKENPSYTLKATTKALGINKNVTPHTFRRTLNTLRFHMGCDERIMCILINHAWEGVNFNSYVKLKRDSEDGHYEEFLTQYDKWNPYKDVQL